MTPQPPQPPVPSPTAVADQSLLDALPHEAVVVDEAGVIVAINQRWRQAAESTGRGGPTLGLGMVYSEICRQAGASVEEGEDAPQAVLAAVLSGRRQHVALTYRCGPTEDAAYYDVRMSRFEAEGRPYALILHEDSTRAHRARRERVGLLRTARWLHLAAAATDNAVIVTDARGVVLWVNQAFTRLTEWSAQEAIGRSADAMLGGEDPPSVHRACVREAMARGEPIRAEVLNHSRSGRPYWVSTNCQPVRNERGTITNFVLVEGDITARRRADDALRASEERFRLLVESAPAPICVTQDGRFVYANRAAAALFGAPEPASLIGRAVLETAPPGAVALIRRREHAARQHSSGFAVTEEARCRLDGSPLDVVIARSPCTHEGRPAVQCVLHDLSLLRRLENELRHAQKMDLIGQFASGLAHDFNNLLTAIFGHVALARSRLHAGHPALEPLDMVEQAAQQAAAITKALLTFGRKTFTNRLPTDLEPLIRDVADLLTPLLPPTVRLRVLPAERSPAWVQADPDQLRQVLMNLALNARDAMPQGGELALGVRFRPAADGRGPQVGLMVRDTGSGMSPDVQARIFEPFFTTKPRGQGTGLGLSMVHGLVEAHGGTISVASAPGAGSTFTVWLDEIHSPPPATPDTLLRGDGQRVLVISRQQHVRGIVSASLRTLGFTAEPADVNPDGSISTPTSPQSLRAAVVDIDGLPDAGAGAMAALGDCPLVMLHGDGMRPPPVPRGIALRKPVRIPELAAHLAMLLRQKHA